MNITTLTSHVLVMEIIEENMKEHSQYEEMNVKFLIHELNLTALPYCHWKVWSTNLLGRGVKIIVIFTFKSIFN